MSCRRRRFKCSNVFAAHFFTALGIGVKQGHRLLVRLELDLVVGVIEIIAVLALRSSSIFWCSESRAAGKVVCTLPLGDLAGVLTMGSGDVRQRRSALLGRFCRDQTGGVPRLSMGATSQLEAMGRSARRHLAPGGAANCSRAATATISLAIQVSIGCGSSVLAILFFSASTRSISSASSVPTCARKAGDSF